MSFILKVNKFDVSKIISEIIMKRFKIILKFMINKFELLNIIQMQGRGKSICTVSERLRNWNQLLLISRLNLILFCNSITLRDWSQSPWLHLVIGPNHVGHTAWLGHFGLESATHLQIVKLFSLLAWNFITETRPLGN